VHNISDIRQKGIHKTELLLRGSRHLEDEIAIAKLKTYKSPDSDQISAELIQAEGDMFLRSINTLIPF
jgi:hypothetical protein